MKRIALILCLIMSLPLHAKQSEMSFALFNKDYATLLRLAKPLSSEEDCSALYYLGRYFEQVHAEKDFTQAISFYSRVLAHAPCARQNLEGRTQQQHVQEAAAGSPFMSASAAAAERMALLYHRGDDELKADQIQAVHWWRVAKNYGSLDAVYRLGLFHLHQGQHERGIRYLYRHLELIKTTHADHPKVQGIESRESNYALGKLFLDPRGGFYDHAKAVNHLRKAAVLGGIEPSYLLALAYAQRDANRAFAEPQGRTVSDDDIKLAIAFLERAVERDVSLPHLKLKRVQGQLLLSDLLFRSYPDRARSLTEAAATLIGQLDPPSREMASRELTRLKQKWGME